MRYILLITLSAMAFGQSPESEAMDPAERTAAVAAKLDRVSRLASNAVRENDDKTVIPKARPSFSSKSSAGLSNGRKQRQFVPY